MKSSVETRAEEPLKRVAPIAGLLCVLLTAGCAAVKPSPPVAPSPIAAAAATPSTTASATPRDTKSTSPAAKSLPTAPTAPVTKATAPTPTARATNKDSAPPVVAKQKAPQLDLASLETRLKETSAIGVLTKIALKNQVDDLLGEFRAFYQRKIQTTLAELRRSYDLLVLKVLALLQDSDPQLASAIVASREAIWGILSDPAKFATI